MTRQWDYSLMMLWLAAVTVGLVMVASAAYPIALRNGAQTHLVIRHGIYLFGGLTALFICAVVPLRLWLDIHRPLLIAALLLTAMVFLPILGHSAKGSSRWIALGPISIQSAEVAKFALVVYLAGYLTRNQAALSTDAIALVRPLALVGLLCILLLAQPDFGSVVVLAAVTGGVLFLAGARLRHFLLIVVVAGALLAMISVLQPYRLQRMITFLDPWADPFESGYQLTQALIAFGRGDLFGLGLGAGIQKLSYLPEAHNDFIFAVIAEELGLVGALVVFALLVDHRVTDLPNRRAGARGRTTVRGIHRVRHRAAARYPVHHQYRREHRHIADERTHVAVHIVWRQQSDHLLRTARSGVACATRAREVTLSGHPGARDAPRAPDPFRWDRRLGYVRDRGSAVEPGISNLRFRPFAFGDHQSAGATRCQRVDRSLRGKRCRRRRGGCVERGRPRRIRNSWRRMQRVFRWLRARKCWAS